MSRHRSVVGSVGAGVATHEASGPAGLELPPRIAGVLKLERSQLVAVMDESAFVDAGSLWPFTLPERRQAAAGEVRAKKVFGDEDRTPVTKTNVYPWRAVCALRITAANGSVVLGSGWLASPRLVVTAGHCVYQHDRGGWARSVEVVPGRNAGENPFGVFTSRRLRSVSGWIKDRNPTRDYGAVLLAGEKPSNVLTSWFGYGTASASDLKSQSINLAGYPVEPSFGTQWWHARRIDLVRTDSLGYTIDTEGGQSGAPLWRRRSDGGRHVVGIHTGYRGGRNQAVRINHRVFNNLSTWARQAAGSLA